MTETDLENALYGVVATACGSVPVAWDRQRAPRPAPPFATLHLEGPAGYSGAAPEWHRSFDPDVAHGGTSLVAGGEIVNTTIHHHEYTLRVQTYATTQPAAREVVMLVHDAVHMESVRDALRAASGIVIAKVGAVRNIGALLDTDWEGRALIEIVIRVADVVTERVGYIATVGLVDGFDS